MAKKRRKPQNRSRNRPTGAATRTAERPQPSGSGDAGPDPDAAARTEPKADQGPKRPASSSHRPATAPLRTRAEKKELARAEREAVRRQIARAQRRRQLVWIAGLAIAVAAGVFFFTDRNDSGTPSAALPGVLTTKAPWPANADQSAARATALGLPPEAPTPQHEHAHLQIFIHGKEEPVPANIGISDAGAIQSLHTHSDPGVVHIESSVSREFTLGEFFGVWGVRFTPDCLGAYCNDGTNHLQVFVNGEDVTDSLQDVQLDDQTVIVVTYGTTAQLPEPIPSTFDFTTVSP